MDSPSHLDLLPVIAPSLPPSLSGRAQARGRERRASGRLQVEVFCEERQGTCRYFRVTTDLSTFGLSTGNGDPHPAGTRVHLVVHLPDSGPPLELSATSVGKAKGHLGTRLAFKSPPAEAVRRIHRFLKTHI